MAPKAKFTKQQLQELIDSGKDVYEIADTLGVNYFHIYNRCRKFGIKPPAVKSRSLIPYSELKELIEQGATTGDIIKKYNCCRSLVSKTCRKYGLLLPKRGRADRRVCRCDESFFSTIDSEEKAYILGFITADGYVLHSNGTFRLGIKIRSKDIDLMNKICSAMRCNFTPKIQGKDVVFCVHSEQLFYDLAKYGIVPRKTLIVPFAKNVPPELIPHYMRGVFDGDGSIANRYRGASLTSGSENFMNGFKKWYESRYGFSPYVRNRPGTRTIIAAFSRKDKAFLDDMYSKSKIHLERKRERYLRLWPIK